jgi:aryl-alcohol dehydrogenase-like predicted oxidoreductase
MEFRTLGNSGVRVSCLALGSWLTYEFMPEDEALAVIRAGIEAGINFLDDARYNDRTGHAPMKTGYSEVLFGRLLRRGGWKREDLVIANKLWYEFYPEQSAMQELESSLSRLEMEYLDIAYCETPPANLPIVEMVGELNELIKSGKLRHWGVLNWSIPQIEEAYQVAAREGWSVPCAAQLRYSILAHSPVEDRETQDLFRSTAMCVVASYSLHGGLLSGKYYHSDSRTDTRLKEKELESVRAKGLDKKVEQIVRIAEELGCTPAQLALAYCLKNNLVTSVLFGATRVTQVQENVEALEVLPRFTEDVMQRLRNLE